MTKTQTIGRYICYFSFICLQSNYLRYYEIKTKMLERASLWHFKVYNARWVQIVGNTLYIWPQYGESKQNSVYYVIILIKLCTFFLLPNNYTNNAQGIYFRLDLMPVLLLAYRDLMRAVRPETYPYILRKCIKSSLK